MRLIVPTLFGLEALVADELTYMGMQNVHSENGRVFFDGDFEEVAKANIWVRMGERVLIELNTFPAHSFEDLFQGVLSIPWEQYIGKTDTFPVKGWSLNSDLHSVPDCQSIIKKAIVTRLQKFYKVDWLEETGPKIQIQFSIMKDEATIMLDTTGPGLYKRGYRANANEAPMRETLAAGLVDLAHVHADSVVVDPMCGSGTLLIEAAMKAKNIAPGLMRRFEAEKWSCFPEDLFAEERRKAREMIRPDEVVTFRGIGYDIDPAAVQLTLENAKKAHVEKWIEVSQADVADLKLPKGKVKVICNPPYGERLMEKAEAEKLYQLMGRKMPPSSEKNYYLISSHEMFEQYFGRRSDKKRKLYNGMLQCFLYMYYGEHAIPLPGMEDRGRNGGKGGRKPGSSYVAFANRFNYKDEAAEQNERTERSERGDRPNRFDHSERGDRPNRFDHSDRGDRPNRFDHSERGEHPAHFERSERRARGERPARDPNKKYGTGKNFHREFGHSGEDGKSEFQRSPERDGVKRDFKRSPERDGAKHDFKRSPERDGAKRDFKRSPERDGAKHDFQRSPERDGAKRDFKRSPESDGVKHDFKRSPERDGAKRDFKRSPERDGVKPEFKKHDSELD